MRVSWKKTLYSFILVGFIAVITVYYFVDKTKNSNANNSAPVVSQTNDEASKQNEATFEDIDFAKKMILIDQQTMQIAGFALQKTTNVQVKNISATIYADSLSDSRTYILLLKAWNEPYLNLSDYPQQEGHDKYPTFPGMSALSQVQELQDSQEASFDQSYVKFMINRHKKIVEILDGSANQDVEAKQANIVYLRSENVKKLKNHITQMQQFQ